MRLNSYLVEHVSMPQEADVRTRPPVIHPPQNSTVTSTSLPQLQKRKIQILKIKFDKFMTDIFLPYDTLQRECAHSLPAPSLPH